VFCANFYWSVGGYAPCRKMWCGACYVSNPETSFHIRSLSNEEDTNGKYSKDLERLTKRWGSKRKSLLDFHVERNGDHAMVPFQCDLCIFRKLRKTSQDFAQPDDRLLMTCIRRMKMDVFWSRASLTVNGNWDRSLFGIKMSRVVGLHGPIMGLLTRGKRDTWRRKDSVFGIYGGSLSPLERWTMHVD
jgi:hypothetical protein